jgi:DNA modification methylase
LLDLPDKSVNLIIADPPYYKIKGDFDFEFKDFQEYLNFMEGQAKLYKRVLADNGSLFVYGHAKNIAYVQVIFDKYFNLENSLVWEKKECQTNIGLDDFRSFAPITERILFYSLEEEEFTGKHYEKIKYYFWDEYEKSKLTLKKANELMGLATTGANLAGELFGKNRDRFCFPTKEKYELLQTTGYFRREYEDLRREYEDLRREYEDLRRPFNNKARNRDVMRYSQEAHLSKQFDHDTIKPERLTLDLIETTTKENDLILIPFGGSGTECVCAMRLKRQWVAFENKKKYYDIAMNRILSEYEKTSLFNSLGGRQLQLSA